MSKTTLDSIILQYRAELNQGLNELAGHGTPEEQLRRAILRWLENEVIGEDDEQVILPDQDGFIAMQRTVGRNQLRAEQRKVLAQHGYKGEIDE